MHGGVKVYRGAPRAARNYVEADRSRADDYYLAEGTGIAQRLLVDAEGRVVAAGGLFCLTEVVLLDSISGVEIRFTQAARKHRIGRASARHVMATSTPTAMMTGQGNAAWLYIGLDERDRELEVIALEVWADQDQPYLLVIHVMPTSLRR